MSMSRTEDRLVDAHFAMAQAHKAALEEDAKFAPVYPNGGTKPGSIAWEYKINGDMLEVRRTGCKRWLEANKKPQGRPKTRLNRSMRRIWGIWRRLPGANLGGFIQCL